MKWATEKPTKDGYYWFKSKRQIACVVYISFKFSCEFITFVGSDSAFEFKHFIEPQFYGPMEIPK